MSQFEGKVAIITGASRGIGKGLALALASRGTAVVAASKTMESGGQLPGSVQETVQEIEAAGGRALGLRCDVRDADDLEHVVARTVEEFGGVDILVNNAGAMWVQPVEGTPQKRFDLVNDINYRAPFLLSHLCLPHMRRRGWGHIVNMAPPLPEDGPGIHLAGKMAYIMSKFNATLMAFGLARELEGQGIACNAIWPRTMIDTAATRNLGFGGAGQCRSPEILVDATMAVLDQDPRELTGQALIDDEILSKYLGVTDLTRYRAVADEEPTIMTWEIWDAISQMAAKQYFDKIAAGDSAGAASRG